MTDFWDSDFENRHNDPDFHRFGEAFLLPKLPQPIGNSLSEGNAQGPARSDHVHTLPTGYNVYYVGATEPTNLSEGVIWVETDTDTIWIYNGSAWEVMAYYGAPTTDFPIVTGSGSNPTGNGSRRYVRDAFSVSGRYHFSFTTAGTGTYSIPLPFAASYTAQETIGSGFIYDSNTTFQIPFTLRLAGSGASTALMFGSTTYGGGGVNFSATVPFTVAVGDYIECDFSYFI